MGNKSVGMSDGLYQYTLSRWLREPEVLRELREETALLENAGMQISPDQGQLMGLLAKLIGARKCLEVGVFTGYSSLVVALALPDNGHIVACDVSDGFTQIARRYWERAGVEHKIDLRLAPANDTLQLLVNEGHEGSFDMAFIDADKPNYLSYYEAALRLLKSGGMMLIDNVLWSGQVADPAAADQNVEAIREVNRHVHADHRVELALIPIADGLTVVRKK